MATCTSCGSELTAGAEFCGRCGQKLDDPGSPPYAVKDSVSGPLYEIRTRQWFKKAWKIFKSYPAGFLGFGLILLLTAGLLGRLTKSASILGILLGAAVVPLYAGLYIVPAKLLQRQTCRFEDFFSGFHYFLPLVSFGLITGIVARIGYFLPDDFLLRLLCRLVFLVFIFYYVFTPLLIVDRRLGWWEAMELSQQTVRAPGASLPFYCGAACSPPAASWRCWSAPW